MKKLFSKPPVLICGSVVLLILCFLMNRYFNTTQVPWPIRSALTTLIIFVSLVGVFRRNRKRDFPNGDGGKEELYVIEYGSGASHPYLDT